MTTTLRHETDDQGVMTVWFDHAGRSVNTFTPAALKELSDLVDSIAGSSDQVNAVIFASAKQGVFITGADLFEMSELDAAALRKFLAMGQEVFDRIAGLPMPTVAAINGHCLGGGMELALACRFRVAVDDGSINLGLPEIKLGILPAWGGTTRMTRMLGLTRALPMMLAGKIMPPRKAMSAGMIDAVVQPEALLAAAHRLVGSNPEDRKLSMIDRAAVKSAAVTGLLCRAAKRQAIAKTYGNYPAAERLIDVAHTSILNGHQVGLDAERDAAIDLFETDTSNNLRRLFFLRHHAKKAVKDAVGADPMIVERAAVIGGGTMGAGIVHALVRAGIPVRLVEVDDQAASAGLCRVCKMLDRDRKSKRISPLQMRDAMRMVSPTTNWSGLDLVDFVIEAATEKADVKKSLFQKLDGLTRADTVLATNTSSLSVSDLAAATQHPGRVIGLHFFNPVPQMPLVEVVRAGLSSDVAVATGGSLALRLGKVPVIVNDAPGFLVNRVLIPYLAEALAMAAEGAPIAHTDLVMKRWGMPMGPYELLDQIGLDIAVAIFDAVGGQMGDGRVMPKGFDRVIERGWLGRKSGRGFYDYGSRRRIPLIDRRGPRMNRAMIDLLSDGKHAAARPSDSDIEGRLILPMVNEAACLLREGVVDSTDAIDLATVMGLGLAPFRGGLIRYTDTTGLDEIVERMNDLATRHGRQYTMAGELHRLAESNQPMQALTQGTDGRPASGSAAPSKHPQHS